jgi:hypothetical protein
MEIVFNESFNWVGILKDLAAGSPLTQTDHRRLVDLAFGWPTCACGQLCKDLPRTMSGAPRDAHLVLLGQAFAGNIQREEWQWALDTFHRIEKRTTKLLTNGNCI